MLRLIFLIGILLLFCSCSPKDNSRDFYTFIKTFEYYYNQEVQTRVIFVPEIIGGVGKCLWYVPNNIVIIDEGDWNTLSESQRLYIILHELGHCELNRPHTTYFMSDGCPISLMHTPMSSVCFQNNEDYYIRELFLDWK